MGSDDIGFRIEEIARELDLIVFQLERPEGRANPKPLPDPVRLRRELERLRDRLNEIARGR